MDDELRNTLHDFTLKARQLLIEEASHLLEGIYGVLPDGSFQPAEGYRVLQEDAEAAETRRRLESYFDQEQEAGHSPRAIHEGLTKEVAFTWLNRLVAFKMMEARQLIRQTVSRGSESNGFKLWLTEAENEKALRDYERGDFPQDARGEGPRQRAYRHYLLFQCRKLAQEINVLFDPENLASRLCPRPAVLEELVERINDGNLENAWQPGNEETIGWIYQYFNEPDLEIFRGESSVKVPRHLVGPRTQQYTPHWVVRFLVENSLGRLWLEMHPDSALSERLEYLVKEDRRRSGEMPERVCDIRILDPACGTMHFGLIAFDLLAEMYQEELARAGSPGWPDRASVQTIEDVPQSILANNIHGIDIDLRSVQLATLALYLKAKTLSPEVKLTRSQLACAEVDLIDGERVTSLLESIGLSDQPVYQRILETAVQQLRDSRHLGSLIRPEEKIAELVEVEFSEFMRSRQNHLYDRNDDRFRGAMSSAEYWKELRSNLQSAIQRLAVEEESFSLKQTFFAREASEGLRLSELLSRRYTLILTNPPYLDSRDQNSELKKLLTKHYPQSKRNLYSAFVERSLELLAPNGRLAILTGQTFMFISTFKAFRKRCLDGNTLEFLLQFDYGLFRARVDTAAFILRRSPGENAVGTYLRLVKEPDAESKRQRFEEALERLRAGQGDPIICRYRQSDFDAIPGSPWVYWITENLRRLFNELPALAEVARPRQGLATADNFRFLRFWWEVGKDSTAFDCRSGEESLSRPEKWYPYMKGGGFARWYGNQEYCINYGRDGGELKAWADPLYGNSGWSRIIKSTNLYFRRGVTYSYLTSGNFSARLSPGGFIFDVAGSSLFPDDIPLVLAVLNSTFSRFALKLINPTVNFQVGDLARLPVPEGSSETLKGLVDSAIQEAVKQSEASETTYDFIAPPPWHCGTEEVSRRQACLAELEAEIDEEVYRLYGISEEDRAAIEQELGIESQDDAEPEGAGSDDEPEEEEALLSRKELARRWVSYAVGIVMGRFQPGVEGALGRGRFDQEVARELRQMADPDGILVQDAAHPDDLASRVLEALQLMLSDQEAEEIVRKVTGKSGELDAVLRDYLERSFWKEHIQQYRKRPAYWLMQSPKKSYGIWLFHEKITDDTLFLIQREYVEPAGNILKSNIDDLRPKLQSAEGADRRRLENELAELEDRLADLTEFNRLLSGIISRGYRHHIDDGIILNMAPLWELFPSWKSEPKKYWQRLENGDYDWSHQAMDHWPDRVRKACGENRSFAIAHGLINPETEE